MKHTFEFYSDPSHGWLKVPKQLLHILGIAHNISHYSYDKNGYVYLEEDRDMSIFVGAFEECFKIRPSVKDRRQSNKQSCIRNYERYDAHFEMTRHERHDAHYEMTRRENFYNI